MAFRGSVITIESTSYFDWNANDWKQFWMGFLESPPKRTSHVPCLSHALWVPLPGHKFVGFGGCILFANDIHMAQPGHS